MTVKALGGGGELTGRHVLVMLVSFFAVVMAVNSVFLFEALNTHTGVVANEPYRMGLHYNERIAEEAAQAKLGWAIDIRDIKAHEPLSVSVRSAEGAPVRRLKVTAVISRPATARYDARLTLAEVEAGVYRAEAGALGAGNWILDVDIEGAPTGEPVRARRRLWLKP